MHQDVLVCVIFLIARSRCGKLVNIKHVKGNGETTDDI